MAAAADEIGIDELLADLGLAGAHAELARVTLEEAGLTNPRKRNISTAKLDRAQAALERRFQRLCPTCIGAASHDDRLLVRVESRNCERCGGSNNGRAVRELAAACSRAGIARIVFVGGSPSFRRELERLAGDTLELRLVDGTKRATRESARTDVAWADLVVVCGGTELAHKVSNLYTRDPAARRKLVQTRRRGIEAIADEVARSERVARP